MKKVIVALLLMFNTTVFASAVCDAYNTALDVGAFAIAETFECEYPEIIRVDIERPFEKFGFCSQKGLEEIVCPAISKFAVETLNKSLPEHWGCEPKIASRLIDEYIMLACEKYIFRLQ
jgi:hypothetical protein